MIYHIGLGVDDSSYWAYIDTTAHYSLLFAAFKRFLLHGIRASCLLDYRNIWLLDHTIRSLTVSMWYIKHGKDENDNWPQTCECSSRVLWKH